MDKNDLPFLGGTPAEVKAFVGESYGGRRVVPVILRNGLDVSTNGVPKSNVRESVRQLASQTLHAVQLLRVMRDGVDKPLTEFLVIELDMRHGPLANVASIVPQPLYGRSRIYTALCTSCLVERSLDQVYALADGPRPAGRD